MNATELQFDDLVRSATEEDRRELDEHPSAVELLAYFSDELEERDEARVREHLSLCRDCSRTLMDLAAFPEVNLEDDSLRRTSDEEDGDWRSIEAGIKGRRVRSLKVTPPSLRRAPAAVYALAAGLAVAVMGLSLWIASLRQQTESLSGLRSNVHAVDLSPEETSARRVGGTEAADRVPEGMDYVLFFLNGADPRLFGDYQAELVDDSGVVVRSLSGLRRAPEGNFSIELPRSELSGGWYRIRLYGVEGQERNLLATYRFDLEAE